MQLGRKWAHYMLSNKVENNFIFLDRECASQMYYFAMAAMTVPQTVWLKQQTFIPSQFWSLVVPDQGIGRLVIF